MTGDDTSGRAYWRWAGLGFEFAGVMGLFLYFGYLADRRWRSEPWGLLTGGAVGLIGGLYLLLREAYRMMRELNGPNQDGPGARDQTKDRQP